MRRLNYLILFLLLPGCWSKDADIINTSRQPEWLFNVPGNAVSTCALIQNNDLMASRQVAIAKAKAEYLTMRHTSIESIGEIHETVGVSSSGSAKLTQMSNHIRLTTSGEIGNEQGVLDEKRVNFDGKEKWCVLFGDLSTSSK